MVASALTVARQVALRDFEPRILDARIHAVAVGTPLIAWVSLAPGKKKRNESEKPRKMGYVRDYDDWKFAVRSDAERKQQTLDYD